MADKTLKIQANFSEGGSSGPDPVIDDEGLKKLEAISERNNALLGTFIADTFGSTGTPEDFKREKGKAGRPKKEKTEEEEAKIKKNASFLNKVLTNTQKVVIALNGTNGRVTKAMAVFNRAILLSTEFGDKNNKAQATKEKQEGDEKAEAGEVATKGVNKFALSLGKATRAIGGSVAVLAAFVTVVGLAGKLFTSLIDNLKEVTGGLSGALQMAEANTKVAEIQQKMNASQKVGGELASLEGTNREIKMELIRLKTNIIDAISGILQFLGDMLSSLLKILNGILEVINSIFEFIKNAVVMVLEKLEWIPIIGSIVKPIVKWLTMDEVGKALQKGKGIITALDGLGKVSNLNLPDHIRKKLTGPFLPVKKRK